MPKITISYRRDDSEAITGRIFDRLMTHYGRESVFRDIDNIPPGIDFREHIGDALQTTDIVMVVIGAKWVGQGKGGTRRLFDEADPVRIEVETALRRRIPVIPILIGETRMPKTDQLPDSLKDFAFRNAVKVDVGQDFDHHMDRLIRSMDRIFESQTRSLVPAPVPSSEPIPPAAATPEPPRPPVSPLEPARMPDPPVVLVARAAAAAAPERTFTAPAAPVAPSTSFDPARSEYPARLLAGAFLLIDGVTSFFYPILSTIVFGPTLGRVTLLAFGAAELLSGLLIIPLAGRMALVANIPLIAQLRRGQWGRVIGLGTCAFALYIEIDAVTAADNWFSDISRMTGLFNHLTLLAGWILVIYIYVFGWQEDPILKYQKLHPRHARVIIWVPFVLLFLLIVLSSVVALLGAIMVSARYLAIAIPMLAVIIFVTAHAHGQYRGHLRTS